MPTGIIVKVNVADRRQHAAIAADRNSPQKHVWRAQIVLLKAEGCGTAEIMRRADASKTTVWRWQERYMTDGVAGLLRDKTRPSRIPPLTAAVASDVASRTLAEPPGETTHWTAPAMAKVSGISCRSIDLIRQLDIRRGGCPTKLYCRSSRSLQQFLLCHQQCINQSLH